VYAVEELQQQAVIQKFRTTAADGKSCLLGSSNLDAFISVGYRINNTPENKSASGQNSHCVHPSLKVFCLMHRDFSSFNALAGIILMNPRCESAGYTTTSAGPTRNSPIFLNGSAPITRAGVKERCYFSKLYEDRGIVQPQFAAVGNNFRVLTCFKNARDRIRTTAQNTGIPCSFEITGAKSGAVDGKANDLASILVAIANLPVEQQRALAKFLAATAATAPEELP
jgi:hypothetical protein